MNQLVKRIDFIETLGQILVIDLIAHLEFRLFRGEGRRNVCICVETYSKFVLYNALNVAYDTIIGTTSFIVGGANVSIIYQIYN